MVSKDGKFSSMTRSMPPDDQKEKKVKVFHAETNNFCEFECNAKQTTRHQHTLIIDRVMR